MRTKSNRKKFSINDKRKTITIIKIRIKIDIKIKLNLILRAEIKKNQNKIYNNRKFENQI
jgi:hypothetical protein